MVKKIAVFPPGRNYFMICGYWEKKLLNHRQCYNSRYILVCVTVLSSIVGYALAEY